jgi:hypothetical protein
MPEEIEQGLRPYTPKSEKAREQLAQDISAGKVWGPWSIDGDTPEKQGAYLESFYIMRMMIPNFAEWCEENQITCLYEYLHEAGPRGGNDKPVFYSMQVLNADDFMDVMLRVVDIARANLKRLKREGT